MSLLLVAMPFVTSSSPCHGIPLRDQGSRELSSNSGALCNDIEIRSGTINQIFAEKEEISCHMRFPDLANDRGPPLLPNSYALLERV